MKEIRGGKFDYSLVEKELAEKLKEKDYILVGIHQKYSGEVGKLLYEAQQEFSKHGNGHFQKWYEAKGFSKQNTYNYINTYNESLNLDKEDLEVFEKLPRMLQVETSKKNIDAGLKEQVLSGDITTHKEFKELESKLKESESRIDRIKESEEIALRKLEEEQSKEPTVVEKEVIKEVVPENVKERINFLEDKAGDLDKYKKEVNDYQRKKSDVENELAELYNESRKITQSNDNLANQATLINSISLPVSHLEKKQAEIEQLLQRDDVELSNHARNTLRTKSDFLMKMAVMINRYLESENYAEVIDIEE